MNTTITSTPKQIGKHLAAAEAEPSSRPVFREPAPKTEKETSAINIVLTVIILILSVSIVGYLFSLQPWRQESEVESVQPCEEEICADAETEVPEAPVKAVPLSSTQSDVSVTPVEEALAHYDIYHDAVRKFITFRPYVLETDPVTVFEAYRKDADNGDAEAQFFVFLFELLGIGSRAADPNEMLTYLRTSAENGYALAQYELALSYAMSGLADGYANAKLWYEKAAEQGLPMAQNNLGNMYYRGKGIPADYQKAYALFAAAAEQGIAEAQTNLGEMLANGDGVQQDLERAFELFYQAANAGYPLAQSFVADFYYEGNLAAPDMEKAFYWYSLAAAQGESWSQGKLGYMYEQGQGTAQNFEAAMAWYQRAADQGDSQAQFRLGLMYAVGSGAEQDLRKAFDCFNAAAQQGFAPAQCMLGSMYEHGEGTGQNYLLAAQWYQKAAEQGLTEAQEALEALSAASNSVCPRTWKDAYRELISRSGSEYQFYYIYDIDKDGTPELLLDRGYPEATRMGVLYRFSEGNAVFVDEFSMSHCGFATISIGNGIVKRWAHMGGWAMDLMTMENGMLVTKEIYPYTDGFMGEFPVIEGSEQLYPAVITDIDYLMSFPA